MYPHLITDNTITIFADGTTVSITKDSPTFGSVLAAIKSEDWDGAIALASPKAMVSAYTSGHMDIVNGVLTRNGKEIDHAMVPHILKLHADGFNVEPLIAFLDKVLMNPSMRSRNQIWRFVSFNNITITPEGDLLFYKKVTDTYFDVHTGKTNCYRPGTTHTMPREMVDDDPESTCSVGLHVCSHEYLKKFGGSRTVVCKVNPRDIVSVPIDYNNTKVRVCELYVVS
jgi:hypothetical protein